MSSISGMRGRVLMAMDAESFFSGWTGSGDDSSPDFSDISSSLSSILSSSIGPLTLADFTDGGGILFVNTFFTDVAKCFLMLIEHPLVLRGDTMSWKDR